MFIHPSIHLSMRRDPYIEWWRALFHLRINVVKKYELTNNKGVLNERKKHVDDSARFLLLLLLEMI